MAFPEDDNLEDQLHEALCILTTRKQVASTTTTTSTTKTDDTTKIIASDAPTANAVQEIKKD